MGNAEQKKEKMNTIGLLYDILTYSASSLIIGLIVTLLLVGLLFFIVKSFFPQSTFSLLSIVVGVVLTFFLGYRMITMCGAISLKWMCDDFETYINSLIPENMLHEAVPLSKSDTDMITDKALREFPILSQFVGGGTFIGTDTSTIAHAMATTLGEFLNQFIWQSLLWGFVYLAIAAALVVWTLKKQWDVRLSSSGRRTSGHTATSSGRYSRISHTSRGHSRSSRYRH